MFSENCKGGGVGRGVWGGILTYIVSSFPYPTCLKVATGQFPFVQG